ncbi:MAG: ATP synthase F1 subunit gamma [Candidatus Riflebacteria bacterium HGW-Riflebacteria-2]|jgi:F-type H+-transporting ATPase subunit gamma|nr:MAG: ATP synthase F1 subunit gamma [Candidatus Riflebacteria bacterium HGW-Riflebacteria-2]
MASLRDIRQKIGGVSTTQQITSAMKMMSTARLGRAIEAINLTHAYISKFEHMVQDLKRELPNFKHPCMTARPVKCSCIVVIGGERGLCGGFNHDLNRFAQGIIEEHPAPQKKIVAIGRKVIRYFEQKGIELYATFPDLTVKTLDSELFNTSRILFELYQKNEVDEIHLVYTSFASAVARYLTSLRLLPIDTSNMPPKRPGKALQPFDFYPSPLEIFSQLMPRYLRNLLYRAIVESSASEQSSRMAAMTSATDRAEEIIEELKLDLHRSRQALITREIAEVIAGSQ